MYDLLIKGGRVIDPSRNMDGVFDVTVSGGKIAGVLSPVNPREARNCIDATGRIVTPGLIDMHTHVYDGFMHCGANADVVGVNQGVTTVVDCGSSGHAIFEGFPRYVIPASRTTIYCFLHMGAFGIAVAPELWYPEEINIAATEAVIRSYPDLIRGVKLRICGKLIAREGIAVVKTAQETAKKFRLPLMVHIGDPEGWTSPSLTRELLPLLEEGDIVSHIYTALSGSLLDENGRVFPELIAARERGVIMDAAQGIRHFSYVTARKMIAQGLLPTVITTDVTKASVKAYAYGLTVIMSKYLELGLPIDEIVTMTTINPARVVRIADRKGSLKTGMDADISILEIIPGSWPLPDIQKEVLNVTNLIRPVMTVKAGVPIPPHLLPINEQRPTSFPHR